MQNWGKQAAYFRTYCSSSTSTMYCLSPNSSACSLIAGTSRLNRFVPFIEKLGMFNSLTLCHAYSPTKSTINAAFGPYRICPESEAGSHSNPNLFNIPMILGSPPGASFLKTSFSTSNLRFSSPFLNRYFSG